MKYTYIKELEKQIIKQFSLFYIFLGEDIILLKKNKKIIFYYAKQNDFIESYTINIKDNKDWNQVLHFYNSNHLFVKKKILIINLIITTLNSVLKKNIIQLFFLNNLDILIILQCNKLSNIFDKYLSQQQNISQINIIYCFTPYGLNFEYWLKNEIQDKKINITHNAITLLKKQYEGKTILIDHILNIIQLIWKNKSVQSKHIKNIIKEFSIFTPSDWINSIFQNNKKQALYILDHFQKKKYNTLILLNLLKKDLLILINMKREYKKNINTLFKKNNIFYNRVKFFNNAMQSINFNNILKVIKILLQMDIKIKLEYNDDVWLELKTLTLLLSL